MKNQLLFLLFYILPILATAQNATVSGTIKDAGNGEGLPGATVQVTHATSNTTYGGTSDVNGNFKIEGLRPDGLYRVKVSFTGFQTFNQEGITLSAGQNFQLDVSLSDQSTSLNEVAIVGSRFDKPRSNVDRPVPIDVISPKEIQATGQVDLGQSLQYTAPSFNAVKFGINDGAPFVDPASLRGLGPDQMLVLVNNKRRHKVSFLSINDGVGKGQVGTDVNVVPALSLKRVEVLRDGAAAQYGSDAIGGVINFVLNNASSGGAVSVYGGTGNSKPNLDVTGAIAPKTVTDGQTYNVAANFGLKLAKTGFLNTTLSYSHTNGYDRSGSYKAGAGFYVSDKVKDDSLVKANGINLDRALLGAAENTTYGIFINAGIPINEKWNFYSFGGYTNKYAITGVFTRPPSNKRRRVLEIFPNGYNPIAPGRFHDFSLTAGLKGTLGKDWNADFSVGQGSNRVNWTAENTVNPSLGAASPTEFYIGSTQVTQTLVNADLAKTFRKDEYPNLSVGAGAEFRAESFQQIAGDKASWEAGPLKLTTDVGSSGREGFHERSAGKWNRTNIGLYGEVESDITKNFLVGAALRGENYSDFGGDFSWKVNSRYRIAAPFSVRGSVSRGFRAPSVVQAYYSNYINISFDNAGNSIINPVIPATSELAKVLGIEGLEKETSLDFSGGITSKIGEHFTLTADIYQIDVDNRIMLSGSINTSAFPEFIAAGYPQSANVFVNAIDTRTKGFEFVANYNNRIGSHSKYALNLGYSSMETEIRENRKTSTGIEVVNADAALYLTKGQPISKLIASLSYDFKMVGILFRASHFGEVSDPLATLAVAPTDPTAIKYQVFAGKTLFDVALTVRPIKKLSIAFGVNNLTDVYPDLLQKPQTTNEVVYSRRTNQFGTQGRFLHLTANYTF